VRNGPAEMRAGRKFGIHVDGIVIAGKVCEAVKILLGKAAFKRFNVSLFDLHSVSDVTKRTVGDDLN
jgi:hypothetical protein